MGKRDEVEHLERRAREFMRTAEYQAGEGMYALAMFSSERALQSFLKSRPIPQGVDHPRTHSIGRLLEILAFGSRRAQLMDQTPFPR